VRSIGNQCERTGEPTADRLGDHEPGSNPQRQQQRGLAGTLGMSVTGVRMVAMRVVMAMRMVMIMVVLMIMWAHRAA